MKKIFLFLLLLPMLLHAEIVRPKAANGYAHINEQCTWYQDLSGTQTLAQVFNHKELFSFDRSARKTGIFGRKSGAVFAAFEVQDVKGAYQQIIIDNPNIDSLEIWFSYSGTIQKQSMGSAFPSRSGYAASSRYIVRMKMDGTIQQVMIRAKTRNALIIPLFIANAYGIHNFLVQHTGPELLMLGMVLMLALYHLVMVIWTKSKAQVYYFIYLLGLLAYVFLYLRGFSHFMGFRAQYYITEYAYALGGFTNLAALLFTWHYLNRPLVSPVLRRLYQAFFAVPVICMLLNLAGFRDAANSLVLVMGFTVPLLILSFSIASYRKGDLATLYFILGWLCVSISVFYNSLMVMNVLHLPLSWVPQQLLAATCLEMLLLSAGLGYRYSLLQTDKLALKQKLVQVLQNQNAQLEEKVAARTSDLKAAMTQLEESNAVKARVLGIISHDLKMPFVSLNAALDLLSLNILSPEKARQKIANVKSSIRHISGTLENLLTWSKHQQQNIKTEPETIHAIQLVKEAVNLLQLPGNGKNVAIKTEIPEELLVHADRFQLESVFRNLLSNALKASKPVTAITIGVCEGTAPADYCRFYVHDSGSGVQEPSLAQWLQQQGSDLEVQSLSNGLGLQICKEFLANHQTVLQYQHDESGSTFSFVLPTVQPVYGMDTNERERNPAEVAP